MRARKSAKRAKAAKRQFAMVFDLNKCLGCQCCTVACKTHWTRAPGTEAMWWNIVSTMPGRGTPRDAFDLGGGYRDGQPVPGQLPGKREWGEAWDFEYDETFSDPGEGRAWLRPREHDRSGVRTGTRTSGEASTPTPISSTCRWSA
jgi:nitrate reductase beta subunit